MDRTKMVNEVYWNTLHKEMTKGLNPYDHYDMGFRDAMDRVDDWMDAQPTVPAVPGHTDQYNIAEMAFHNGEEKFREKVINRLMEMQTKTKGTEHALLVEIAEMVGGLK